MAEEQFIGYLDNRGLKHLVKEILVRKKDIKTLKINNQEYNPIEDNVEITITADDLGLGKAVRFIGITETNVIDGYETNSIKIDGKTVIAKLGDVVLKDNYEYIWTGKVWERLGPDETYVPLNSEYYIGQLDISGTTIKYTKGDGTEGTLTTQDSKVTSVSNHYDPKANTNSTLNVKASGGEAASWDSTQLITGINLQRDAKGHVTGITVDSVKMPANPNSNTTYTLSGKAKGNTWVTTLTPSSGSATTSTVPEATTSSAGLMTSAMVQQLGNLAEWVNDYTLPPATASTLGGVKIGNGIDIGSDGKISIKTGYTTNANNKTYKVQTDDNGNLFVNVPWEGGSSDISGTVQIKQGGTGATTADGACENIGAVKKSGDTMTGALQSTELRVRNSNSAYPSVNFYSTDGYHAGSMTQNATNGNRHFYFKQIHNDQNGGNYYADIYNLPKATAGLTGNKTYNILTDKNTITIAQGGTGATEKGIACRNLMNGVNIEPASIELYPSSNSVNHGGYIDFHYNNSTSDHTSRIIESASSVLDINNVSGGKVRLGTVTAGTWNGSAIPVAYGGTGAADAATARTNLGALPGQAISSTLSTAGWYRIASSKVGIDNTIGDFTICGGGSGTHTIVSFKAAIAIGKNPQILQLLNTTYNGFNQYTKARIVYHTTYSGNYAYLEVYKNGTASSSTKFMYYGEGWTLQKPVAGSIPSGYTSKEFTFVPQTSIASAENINVVSDVTGKDFDIGVQNPNGHIALQVSTNRGIWDYDKAAWVLRALKGGTTWHLIGSADCIKTDDGSGSFHSGIATTPILSAKKNGYNHWAIERAGDDVNTLKWHYYNPSSGNWLGSGYLLDHNNFTTYVTPAAIGALPISGGTLTGVLTLKGAQYGADATTGGLNCNNSTITQLNGIYFADTINSLGEAGEGINFVHGSGGTYDTLYAISGDLKFAPNRALGTVGTSYTVYHTGNKPSASDVGAIPTPTAIAASTDLNNITTPGFYHCAANATVATLANTPTGNAFYMEVGKHAGVYQRIVEYTTAGTAKIYIRNYYAGTWSAWGREYTTWDKPAAYSLPTASSSTLGGVKIGSNITISNGTISLTKSNITSALGYTPPTTDTNTTYSAGTGIVINNNQISIDCATAAVSRSKVPYINSDGVMEIGRFVDFHHSNNPEGPDFSARLQVQNSQGGNTLNLPKGKSTAGKEGFLVCGTSDLEIAVASSLPSTVVVGQLLFVYSN